MLEIERGEMGEVADLRGQMGDAARGQIQGTSFGAVVEVEPVEKRWKSK